MILRRIYDPDLAQASFIVACQRSREAIVIDPRRDVAVYRQEAARLGLRITAVTETHIHADYLSGARQLAEELGVPVHLSAEGGPGWSYRFPHQPLRHGDRIRLGSVSVGVVHTPGHTPEHLCFLVETDDGPERHLISGDFVFVGDLGRPDLLDETAGGADTRFAMARAMFSSLERRFLALDDAVRVWPGHGAGSACGKSLGDAESTTVGQERLTSWWGGLVAAGDSEGFTVALLQGQPTVPHYFGRMKRLNRDGPPIADGDASPPRLAAGDVLPLVPAEFLLIDGRSLRGNPPRVPGAVNVPSGGRFAYYSSWVIDPDTDGRPIVLIAADAGEALSMRERLLRVGLDRVAGYLEARDGLPLEAAPTITPEGLLRLEDPLLIDVRSRGEHESASIPGAVNLPGERMLLGLAAVPEDRPVVVHCQGGTRSAVIGSLLRAHGRSNVLELAGGMDAWLDREAATRASET